MIQDTILTDEFLETKKESLESKIKNLMSMSDDEVIQFFSDYIAWNGVFGGAVASLAGKWHNAIHLTPMNEDATRGMNRYAHRIASEIFAAAEDEYSDENSTNPYQRVTHKDMAWAFYTSLMKYYGLTERPQPSREVKKYIEDTLYGYGVSNRLQLLETLIYNLGFHIGSEKIASYEFDFLTSELKNSRPDLYNFLANIEAFDGISALDWLKVHGTVEEEHFQHAIDAAKLAKEMVLSEGIMPESKFNQLLLNGFLTFSELQERVFEKY